MTPGRHLPVRHEAAPDDPAPPANAQQLLQIQLLQRRRKAIAAIQLAAAQNRLRACEARLQETSEALEATRQWTAARRAQQAHDITQAERNTRDLLRWRQGDCDLQNNVERHWRNCEAAHTEHAQAGDEVARRLQCRRQLEAADEKYGAMLEELLEDGRVQGT